MLSRNIVEYSYVLTLSSHISVLAQGLGQKLVEYGYPTQSSVSKEQAHCHKNVENVGFLFGAYWAEILDETVWVGGSKSKANQAKNLEDLAVQKKDQ